MGLNGFLTPWIRRRYFGTDVEAGEEVRKHIDELIVVVFAGTAGVK